MFISCRIVWACHSLGLTSVGSPVLVKMYIYDKHKLYCDLSVFLNVVKFLYIPKWAIFVNYCSTTPQSLQHCAFHLTTGVKQ